jgi:hypothetical protein
VLAEAEQQLLAVLAHNTELHGQEDERTLVASECLAGVLLELGVRKADDALRDEAAELQFDASGEHVHTLWRALEHRRTLYGCEHRSTLSALLNLAEALPKREAMAVLQPLQPTFRAVFRGDDEEAKELVCLIWYFMGIKAPKGAFRR